MKPFSTCGFAHSFPGSADPAVPPESGCLVAPSAAQEPGGAQHEAGGDQPADGEALEVLAVGPEEADPGRAPALLARCEEILRTVTVSLLHFRKSDTFWEVIDAHFE